MTLTISSILYLILVSLIFFNIREALKMPFLALSSLAYVFVLDRHAGWAVLLVSFLTWIAGILTGRLMERGYTRGSGMLSGICITLAVTALTGFKYIPVLAAETSSPLLFGLVMPLGFSFYIFQVISYLADICTGKTSGDKSFLHVLLYLSWFPKFISGPIERKDRFDQQILKIRNAVFMDPARWEKIIAYILTGFVYKIVIADRIGPYVDTIFAHYDGFSSTWLIFGAVLYSFQIYCDFAGYSYAAVGISLVFDIDLTQNFCMPYCSENITGFWRRWHRSLSSWLRDYLYIPLGGNQKGQARKILNTLAVFVLCGLWHGVGTGFLIWGLLHGVYSALDTLMSDRGIRLIRKGISGRIVTFVAVTFAWIFFRAGSASSAVAYVGCMLKTGFRLHTFKEEFYALGLNKFEAVIIIAMLAVLAAVEACCCRCRCAVPEILRGRHYMLRYTVIFILLFILLIFGIYGPAFDSGRMIYMQF